MLSLPLVILAKTEKGVDIPLSPPQIEGRVQLACCTHELNSDVERKFNQRPG